MRPWIKRTLIALFGASLIAGGLAACGHGHHDRHASQWSAQDVAKWRGKLIERAGSELKLDDPQKQRLGTLFDKMNEQRTALVGSTPSPRSELAQLMAGEKFDRSRAALLVQEKTTAVSSKSPELITAAADFYDSLNVEQQAKLREFLAKRRGWRG